MTHDIRFQKIHHEEIPFHLIEQVKPRTWSVERYQDFLTLLDGSPLVIIFGIFKREELIGFTFLDINLLEQLLYVSTLSIEKTYKNDGSTLKAIMILFKKFLNECKLKKIQFSTNRPTLFLKLGLKKSKEILMELEV